MRERSINYSINPIETYYKGILFRSRLEAKWAAMFDLLEWEWDYEPTDFNGWIPDFVIYGKFSNIYVEVKPVTTFPEDVADKISNSGCCNELLILGSTCIIPNEDDFVFGWLGQDYSEGVIETMHVFGNAVLLRLDESKGKIGFCHQDASWQDRITGLYDGSIYCDFTKREIKELWGLAHNKTRWSKK